MPPGAAAEGMALKHVLLGIGAVAALGAGYLVYRYASGPRTPTNQGIVDVGRTPNIGMAGTGNHRIEAELPQTAPF